MKQTNNHQQTFLENLLARRALAQKVHQLCSSVFALCSQSVTVGIKQVKSAFYGSFYEALRVTCSAVRVKLFKWNVQTFLFLTLPLLHCGVHTWKNVMVE